uniref:ABC transporter domain-containing protein n=1 Tax=Polytomella parva TaxID=51329 RepID=A0A7S0UQV4_9CHLO|nr:cysa-like protein chloroplastic (CYSA) [Polytomella parva]|mmetsp:Transcript_18138/g.33141  ORF Transcript_18138/g.33141 Transcript_18138/m.33141 type:complete len:507 (+) Transcript_18138:105-1625(+)|eukprot:CAMPEP_0175051224 /NCGR_PEP_ID=MMETSP0052_2-20121109/7675_1 /TAXON_ID=51329 ORGANISM="Polytomella parva, Strain SAG 63-3" /NCGR_SAMPLE_ID=MMETSP0052_2 /ASSEMBLY_ACC=CAM_ASM_000194 /LENGTH=506 /DNA_ID=CAMNT_0016315473 /DNA_START=79 /DNA_END=1602 /DNA_ORIENTATION=+
MLFRSHIASATPAKSLKKVSPSIGVSKVSSGRSLVLNRRNWNGEVSNRSHISLKATKVEVSAPTQASPEEVVEAEYEGIISDPPANDGLLVRVRNMVKHFHTAKGLFKAVDGVDVDIAPGSIVALLGPSGSGKTTLLRLIAGLENPTDGQIFFNDEDATHLSVQERQIGFVFQSYALFAHRTVHENVRFGLEVRNLLPDQAARDKRVRDLLELIQLQGLSDRYPRQLSGGQRQRVALARALASSPRLLLLDEPFGALDAVVRKQLRAGLKEIVRSVGVTTIIVTHDQEEAFDLADHVVIFNRGIVEQQGSPAEIIRAPRTPFIMKFVGETNVLPSTSLLIRRVKFQTPKSHVMFRPHDLVLLKSKPSEGTESYVSVKVADRTPLGWVIKYTLKFDDDEVVEFHATSDQDERSYNLAVGSRVWVTLRPRALMGFNPEDIDSSPVVNNSKKQTEEESNGSGAKTNDKDSNRQGSSRGKVDREGGSKNSSFSSSAHSSDRKDGGDGKKK